MKEEAKMYRFEYHMTQCHRETWTAFLELLSAKMSSFRKYIVVFSAMLTLDFSIVPQLINNYYK